MGATLNSTKADFGASKAANQAEGKKGFFAGEMGSGEMESFLNTAIEHTGCGPS